MLLYSVSSASSMSRGLAAAATAAATAGHAQPVSVPRRPADPVTSRAASTTSAAAASGIVRIDAPPLGAYRNWDPLNDISFGPALVA